MKIERTKNANRNIVFGSILKVYQMLIPFLMRTAMIYFMGVQYLGLNSLFTSVLQVLNLAELGVGSAMVYSMYKPIAEDDTVTICALMNLYKKYYRIIGLIIALLGLILTPFIPYLIKDEIPGELNIYVLYLLNLSATVFSYWLFAYKNCILQAYQRTDIVSKITIITSTLQYGAQILVLMVLKNYYYYVIAALLIQILNNIVTAVVSNWLFPEYNAKGSLEKKEVASINQKIKDLFTAKLGSVITSSADTLIISSFLGLVDLAIYQNYYFILTAITGFMSVLFSSITAGMGNSFVCETEEKNYHLFEKITFMTAWIISICCCCFACLYQHFMKLWVGAQYLLGDLFVYLIVCFFAVSQIRQLWCTVKDAAGIWHEDRFRPFVSSIVNLILSLVLVKVIGLYGVISASIVSCVFIGWPWLISNIFNMIYKGSPRKYILHILKYMFAIGASIAISSFICAQISIESISGLIIKGVVAVLVAIILWSILFHKNYYYKDTLNYIKNLRKVGR